MGPRKVVVDKEAFPMEPRLEHGAYLGRGQSQSEGSIRGNWRMVNKTGEKEGSLGLRNWAKKHWNFSYK